MCLRGEAKTKWDFTAYKNTGFPLRTHDATDSPSEMHGVSRPASLPHDEFDVLGGKQPTEKGQFVVFLNLEMRVHQRLDKVIPYEWAAEEVDSSAYDLREGEVKIIVTRCRMIGDEEIKGSDGETANMGRIDIVVGRRKMRHLDLERTAGLQYSV